MKRIFAFALVLGTTGGAFADDDLATPWSRPQPTYRFSSIVEGDSVTAATVSHVIYLNNCKTGCTIHPGNDNSTTNTSSIPNATSTVTPWMYSDALWDQLVACVRSDYAPFDVQIVTDRPASGNYHMAVVAGSPQDVGEPNGVGGVSPFSCGYISNSISYSFANVYGGDLEQMCWTVAQETAHSWGLDHKFDARDPMTYLDNAPAHKTYQNEPGACGEYSARQCSCTYAGTGKAQMNAFALIMATFGPNGTAMPPTISLTAPHDGDTVQAGFPIRADASDSIGLTKVEFKIDNTVVSTVTAAPFVANAPTSLGQGNHVVKATATNVVGMTAEASATITLGAACTADGGCSNGQGCVDGHCVAVGGDNGLGTPCNGNGDCASGQCASDGTNKFCVETCNPSNSGNCPDGFGCIMAGGNGVCWPGADNGGGTCNAGGSGGAMLLGWVLGALVIARRKRA